MLTERGFVYSRTNKHPTLSDTKVADTQKSTGHYSLTITGLQNNATYCLRAFVRIGTDIFYGKTIEFTCGPDLVTTTIFYQTSGGISLGTQVLAASNGLALTVNNLEPPMGYVVADGAWQHHVFGSESVLVYVRPASTTPTQSGVNAPLSETPFMSGLGNRFFGPSDPITRRDIARALYNLSDRDITGMPTVYLDAVEDSAKTAIDFVSARKYMTGYSDGTFKPNDAMTRAEMAAVLCNFYALSGTTECKFNDLDKGHWGYPYIALVSSMGIVSGYPDGNFKPDNLITRAEVATLFAKMEHRSMLPIGQNDFIDVSPTHWAYPYIMNVAMP
jgi:hypothetical protein